jgi:acyl-CoA synthetase (AMP-forming)/AMP-acid ligase II
MYTSGTTALPKGVLLSYGGFVEYVFSTTEPGTEETTDVVLLVAPIYHVAGCSALMTAVFGAKLLVIQRQFEPTAWLEAVQNEKVTNAFVVPTMLKRILDHPDFDKYDLSSLQMLSYGAAPMPLPVIRRAIEKFPKTCSFMNAFGQTETTSTVTLLGPEDHRLEGTEEEIQKKLTRLASIGRPAEDVTLLILDENGNAVPPGTIGEIAIRVPRAMSGYWKREEETSKTLVDGWIRTRDMGWIDEDGYVFLAGRMSDMIIRGGENIAPEQVEGVLNSHPAVDECAVIGIPSEDWGETVKDIVVLKKDASVTEHELIQYCKQHMSSFKAPESVEFTDELPRNSVGKILKNVLREKYKTTAKV